MSDPTENIRRAMVDEINSDTNLETKLAETQEKTWTTLTLTEEFDVLGFMAPFVVVRRKSDGKKGSLQFKHSPRIYYGFVED
jgi:hypothetical protein